MLCRFLTGADGISQYYKPIVDKLQVFLRTALRHSGQLQATAVDLLARRAEHLPDLAVELQPLLPGLLTSYNVAVQSSTLKLLAVLLRQEPDQRAGGLWQQTCCKSCRQIGCCKVLRGASTAAAAAWRIQVADHS